MVLVMPELLFRTVNLWFFHGMLINVHMGCWLDTSPWVETIELQKGTLAIRFLLL